MAVYKVIQDIEAEDKLLGPLTLKGFIYAGTAAVLAFICIRLAISGVPMFVKILFILILLPPTVLLGTLASPLGREQPTEVWLMARIRFLTKPKVRRWDQSGIKQLVTITVPKKVERILTKNFSQNEVSNRLQALANTLDSRGWAVKNVAINAGAQPNYFDKVSEGDDRLSDATVLTQEAPVLDVHPADDILDEENNPAAQNMQERVFQAEEDRKLAMQQRLEDARREAEDEANIAQSSSATTQKEDANALTPEEEQLLANIHARDAELAKHPPIIRAGAPLPSMTDPSQTVKLDLSQSGNDLSVASISKLANREGAA